MTDFMKGRRLLEPRKTLLKGAGGTFVLKVLNTILSFLTSLLLARLLGARGIGAFYYVISWATVLSIPATMGLDALLIRNVSGYQQSGQVSLLRGLLRFSSLTVITASFFVSSVAFLIVISFFDYQDSIIIEPLLLALLLVPLQSYINVKRSTLIGLQKVITAQVPEMIIRPLLFIVTVFSVYNISVHAEPEDVMIIYIALTSIILFVLVYLLSRYISEDVNTAIAKYRVKHWTGSALTLMMISGMGIINQRADIIMLGAIKGAEEVGIYSVATAGASLVPFVLYSVNMSFAPIISRLYASGDLEGLQREVTHSARIIFIFSLPVALSLIFFGKWILMIFGHEFVAGACALSILSVGQLINVAAGSVGLLLLMTGHERDTSIGIGIGTIVNICLNALLIPLWSIEGAAVATATSMIIWNILLAWFVWKRLGIHSTALGKVSLWK